MATPKQQSSTASGLAFLLVISNLSRNINADTESTFVFDLWSPEMRAIRYGDSEGVCRGTFVSNGEFVRWEPASPCDCGSPEHKMRIKQAIANGDADGGDIPCRGPRPDSTDYSQLASGNTAAAKTTPGQANPPLKTPKSPAQASPSPKQKDKCPPQEIKPKIHFTYDERSTTQVPGGSQGVTDAKYEWKRGRAEFREPYTLVRIKRVGSTKEAMKIINTGRRFDVIISDLERKDPTSGDIQPTAGLELFWQLTMAKDTTPRIIYSAKEIDKELARTFAALPYFDYTNSTSELFEFVADAITKKAPAPQPLELFMALVAGTTGGFAGDGGPATAARLRTPWGVVADSAGNVYFSDHGNNCVRKIDMYGVITTVAGTGTAGFRGDDGPAASAQLHRPIYRGYFYLNNRRFYSPLAARSAGAVPSGGRGGADADEAAAAAAAAIVPLFCLRPLLTPLGLLAAAATRRRLEGIVARPITEVDRRSSGAAPRACICEWRGGALGTTRSACFVGEEKQWTLALCVF